MLSDCISSTCGSLWTENVFFIAAELNWTLWPHCIDRLSNVLIEVASDLLQVDHFQGAIRCKTLGNGLNCSLIEAVQLVHTQILQRAVAFEEASQRVQD